MSTALKSTGLAAAAIAAAMMVTTPALARHWHHGRHHSGAGAAIGFAAGALIGGALASSASRPYYGAPYAYGGNAVQYCIQRYRSYDPGSGTYLGYDGDRHPCP